MAVDILARAMASGNGGGSSTLGLKVDAATDEISLTKSGEPIPDSGAALPQYGLDYDTATGGLTLTKNGEGIHGETVALPPYGSPLKADSIAGMTDTDKVYVLTTDGHWYYYNGTAWTDGGVYNAVEVVTDKTLTVANVPADAKATGDELYALKTQISTLFTSSEFDFTTQEQTYWTIGSSNIWAHTTSGTARGYCFDVSLIGNPKEITVTANNSKSTIFALLKSYNPVQGDTPDFADGYSARITLQPGDSAKYTIGDDVNYIYFTAIDSSGNDHTPTLDLYNVFVDTTLTEKNTPADAYTTGNEINELKEFDAEVKTRYRTGSVNYTELPSSTFGIAPGNSWTRSDNQKSVTIKIPQNIKKITVTANATGEIIAFLNTYNPVYGESVDYASGYGRISMTANETREFEISGNMNYMFALITTTAGVDKTPSVIVTATDNRLKPVGSDADVSGDFELLLNVFGECQAEKGVYYVKGLHMPAKSKLVGAGFDTVIKLMSDVTSGSAVYMGASSIIKDVQVSGANTAQNANADEGTRNGIEWTGDNLTPGVIDSCRVENFSGSGIYIHDTTTYANRNLAMSNCYLTGNYVGIDIRKNSEFHKITNCTIYVNNIGYRNRGGNNDISNSGIDKNKIGVLIDTVSGSTNEGHGIITGCSINHSDGNHGYGIIIRDTGRMIVSNCNLYYSKILLDNTDGNIFTGCGFAQNAGWEINGGECSIFNGCMVRGWGSTDTPVTITDNTQTKIVNCYDRDGLAYTP